MIKLVPMTEKDFQEYYKMSIVNYAAEKVKAGNWVESESIELAQKAFADLLPDGLTTKDNYFASIMNEKLNSQIGYMWYAVKKIGTEQAVFLYDFVIFENCRRQGYGVQALNALEEKAKEINAAKIMLHVFGHNLPAINLYKKVGYNETNINMTKVITSE